MLLQKALRSIYFSERAFRPINSLKSRAMASARIVPPASMTIELTDTEIQVCTLLDECTQKLQEEKGVKTSCRIAGGWVRDKVGQYFALRSFQNHILTRSNSCSCWAHRVMISISR